MNGINVFKVIINKFGWFNVLVVDIVNGRLWWGDVYLDYIEWVFQKYYNSLRKKNLDVCIFNVFSKYKKNDLMCMYGIFNKYMY